MATNKPKPKTTPQRSPWTYGASGAGRKPTVTPATPAAPKPKTSPRRKK